MKLSGIIVGTSANIIDASKLLMHNDLFVSPLCFSEREMAKTYSSAITG
jgi:hypothetical protein